MYPKGCAKAFEALMQETPYSLTIARDGIARSAAHVNSIVPIGNISPASLRNVIIPHIRFPHGD